MGQFKSYSSLNLERQIADIERELIAYKATQSYGIRQIKSRVSRGAPLSSWLDSLGVHHIDVKVTFVGVNKNKLARGSVDDPVVVSDSRMVDKYNSSILAVSSADNPPNVLQWIISARCAYIPVPFSSTVLDLPGTASFTMTATVYANMSGSVTYETL